MPDEARPESTASKECGPARHPTCGRAADHETAARWFATYDEGVRARARMRKMVAVDWTGLLLYDLVINTGAVGVAAAVGQALGLAATSEFQPTPASRQVRPAGPWPRECGRS